MLIGRPIIMRRRATSTSSRRHHTRVLLGRGRSVSTVIPAIGRGSLGMRGVAFVGRWRVIGRIPASMRRWRSAMLPIHTTALGRHDDMINEVLCCSNCTKWQIMMLLLASR